MIIRKIVLAAATLAALSPAISNASPEKAAAKACASAFATSINVPGATSSAYKLAYRGSPSSVLADFYPTDYVFTLEARDPKTGAAIARARCSTDYRGTVTSIASLPLETKPAELASAF